MKRWLLAFVLLAACSKPEAPIDAAKPQPAAPTPPTIQQAHDLIANSAELGEFQFTDAGFTLPASGAIMSAPARISAKELASAGWLSMERNGDIALTAKSRGDKRFLLRANGLLDIVPLAKKEMGEVTAIHPQPDNTAIADFNWRWIPNEVGTAFKTGIVHDRFASPHTAKATLMWDGSTWTVLKIDA